MIYRLWILYRKYYLFNYPKSCTTDGIWEPDAPNVDVVLTTTCWSWAIGKNKVITSRQFVVPTIVYDHGSGWIDDLDVLRLPVNSHLVPRRQESVETTNQIRKVAEQATDVQDNSLCVNPFGDGEINRIYLLFGHSVETHFCDLKFFMTSKKSLYLSGVFANCWRTLS
jgi:hypothetical protein